MSNPGPIQSGAATPLYRCGRPAAAITEPVALVILGVSGSIGRQTVDLVLRFPEKFTVVAVTVGSRVDRLVPLLEKLALASPDNAPPLVAVADPDAHAQAARLPRLGPRLLSCGAAGLVEAITAPPRVDCVVNGLVGAAGLEPTLTAARRGVRIALANKESLVVGGELVARAVAAGGAELLPVDSEHSAIAQCLTGRRQEELTRIVLTASGGPFRTTCAADLAKVTTAQVLDHPTWDMGPKITVDSATLMNKGLEVIEAHHLFGLPYPDIEVVVHPGSHVHSLVEFRDGALLAQLGQPDMRVPLLYAMTGENRWPLRGERLDLAAIGTLRFEPPDLERFPCLRLARQAGAAGGAAPVVLNAANEVAVAALLAGRLRYVEIPAVIESTLTEQPAQNIANLADALVVDQNARRTADATVARIVASQS